MPFVGVVPGQSPSSREPCLWYNGVAIRPSCSFSSLGNEAEDVLQPGTLFSIENFSARFKADSELQLLFRLLLCTRPLTADEGSSYLCGGEAMMLGR